MDYKNLKEVFKAFADLKVLIVGDVILDFYTYGQANRISLEAPVPVVSVEKREKRLGGAANVALNVQALGAQPILCSLIGNDPEGDEMLKLLEQSNIPTEGFIRGENCITTVKERVLSGHQHMLRIDRESLYKLTSIEEKSLSDHIKKLAKNSHVIIFQDYDKGTINQGIIKNTFEFALANNIPIVVDPKVKNFYNYMGATLFKPNLEEISSELEIDALETPEEDITKAVKKLRKQLQFQYGMINLSQRGFYLDKEKGGEFMPTYIRQVRDVSGVGDTTVSIASLGLALNLPVKLTAELAYLGGRLVGNYMGVVAVDKRELLSEAIKNGLFRPPKPKKSIKKPLTSP